MRSKCVDLRFSALGINGKVMAINGAWCRFFYSDCCPARSQAISLDLS